MNQNIYELLGVKPIINAAGTFTDLGGSLMPPEVLEATRAAAQHFVDLDELQHHVGQRIASMLGVPAALVTGGAASGILLGTAAAITQRDGEFVRRPVQAPDGNPFEVIRLASHRDIYDRQITTCGVKIVEVNSAEAFDAAVTDRTVLAMAYNFYEPESDIKHEHWLALAKTHGIPTLLDAAADTPPVENLWRFHQMGFDMVTFSGGKAIRGPQSSGLLLGRADLIELAKQNAVPNEGTIGRVAKVSKEDIVGLWKAVELFISKGPQNGDRIAERCRQQLAVIESMVMRIDGVSCNYVTPAEANHFPHLLLKWNEATSGLSADDVARTLRTGNPPIATGRVYGTGTEGLLISAINLQPHEEDIVGRRLQECLQRGLPTSEG